MKSNPYRKSLNDALKSADAIFAEIAPQTRTSSRKIASVQIIGDSKAALTRSGEDGLDTMLYLVNYADDQGFALLSADWRTKPVYAFSEEGELNLADTTVNKGLALFMENAKADYEDAVSVTGNPKGPFFPNDSIDIYHPNIDIDDYQREVTKDVKPLLKKNSRLWKQGYPFNIYCPVKNGERCPVGCVAIAVALLCSEREAPSSFDGISLNWSAINQVDPYTNIPPAMVNFFNFLRSLGKSQYLDMHYNPGASSSNIDNARRTLSNGMGFTLSATEDFHGYIFKDHYPVYIRAKKSEGVGHAWVIDGGYGYKITSTMYVDGYASYNFEHCVWGWAGKDNGYYSWSSTSGFDGKPHHFDEDDTGELNYNHNGLYIDCKYFYIIK